MNENYTYQQFKRGISDIEPSQSKITASQINAKISAALKAYPEWAKEQRVFNEPEQPTTKIQQQANSLPSSSTNYDQRRTAAAQRARADMRVGQIPSPSPTAVNLKRFGKQVVTPSTLPMASPAPNANPYEPSITQLIRQRQAKGMTENKFKNLYALLEMALNEQTVDKGSFSQYLQHVLQLDLDSKPEYASYAGKIDTLFSQNKTDEAYRLARYLLNTYYKQQAVGNQGAIKRGLSTTSQQGSTVDRIIQNIQGGFLGKDEVINIMMQSLLRLKNRYPTDYNQLVRDIKGSLSNYEAQINSKS